MTDEGVVRLARILYVVMTLSMLAGLWVCFYIYGLPIWYLLIPVAYITARTLYDMYRMVRG